jgi:hypothetical protein
MGAAVGALEDAGYQYVGYAEKYAANGAASLYCPVDAVSAAADVHQPVFASGYGREGKGFHQIAPN